MLILSIFFSIFMSLIIIGCGFLVKGTANDDINDTVGYRTKLSKKNNDTWKEANIYSGRMFIKCGLIYLVLSVIFSILFYNIEAVVFAGVAIGTLPAILIGVFATEKHLKIVFDSEGNRK